MHAANDCVPPYTILVSISMVRTSSKIRVGTHILKVMFGPFLIAVSIDFLTQLSPKLRYLGVLASDNFNKCDFLQVS